MEHVADLLAEALDNLLRAEGGGEKDCGHDFYCNCPWDKAKAALAEYRKINREKKS